MFIRKLKLACDDLEKEVQPVSTLFFEPIRSETKNNSQYFLFCTCLHQIHAAPVMCFPALFSTSYMFSRAFQYQLLLFPLILAPVTCFPALFSTSHRLFRVCCACFHALCTIYMFLRDYNQCQLHDVFPCFYHSCTFSRA